MGTGMQFCLLGPLTVQHGDTVVPIQRGKQRAVLAALLLNANRVVTIDELTDVLWAPGGSPPSARVTLQNYVKRLRQALGGTGRARIATHPGGYEISVDPEELDVTRFDARLTAARAAVRLGSWQLVADQARAALALWRGEPLVDVQSELLTEREVPRLEEAWLQGMETRIDADVRLGLDAEVIGELRRLVGAYPLRERLHALLMIALHRHGCRGEALAAYQQARRILSEELGTEPGAELHELHQRMLAGERGLVSGSGGPHLSGLMPLPVPVGARLPW